jgi:hypothetical protein
VSAELAAAAATDPAATAPAGTDSAMAVAGADAARSEPPLKRGTGVNIEIPEADAFLTAETIAVAGRAYGRPHGPRVDAVELQIRSAGRVIGGVTLPVYSGLFAGVVTLTDAPSSRRVDIRIRREGGSDRSWVERTVTIRIGRSD